MIHLSPLDLPFVGERAPTIVQALASTRMFPAARVEAALRGLAGELVSVRGTVAVIDDRTMAFVDGGPGPDIATVEVAELPAMTDLAGLASLVEPVVTTPGQPLLRARILDCGRQRLVVISVSHAAMDAVGLARFLLEWTRRVIGAPPTSLLEDRTPLMVAGPSVTPTPEELFEIGGKLWHGRRVDARRGAFEHVSIEIAPLEVEVELARRELGDGATLADGAAAWVCRHHGGRGGDLVLCYPMSIRGRYPGVRSTFLGNAAIHRPITLPRGELESGRLAPIIARVRAGLRANDTAWVTRSLAFGEALFRTRGLGVIDEVDFPDGDRSILVTNVVMPIMTGTRGGPRLSGASLNLSPFPHSYTVSREPGHETERLLVQHFVPSPQENTS